MNPKDTGIRVEPSTTWLVYHREPNEGPGPRSKNHGLSYIAQAYGTAASAFDSVANRENLMPGKYLALSLDLTQVQTATITHRVVMDNA